MNDDEDPACSAEPSRDCLFGPYSQVELEDRYFGQRDKASVKDFEDVEFLLHVSLALCDTIMKLTLSMVVISSADNV